VEKIENYLNECVQCIVLMGKKYENVEASLKISSKNYTRIKKFGDYDDTQNDMVEKVLDKAEKHIEECEK
jgi:predicted PolB exonuclease-like 3'-5' exonuclease